MKLTNDKQRLPMVRLSMLGPVSIAGENGQIKVGARKCVALLVYLAQHIGNDIPRESVRGLLWPDSGEDQAKGSLRQSLTMIRKSLGPAAVALQTDKVNLKLKRGEIETDVREFYALIKFDDTNSLERLAQIYRGDFLDGFGSLTPEFDRWIDGERSAIHAAYSACMVKLCQRYSEDLKYDDVIKTAHALLTNDPLREDIHRILIRAYQKQNRLDAALGQFAKLQAVLSSELGVEPDSETIALISEVRNARLRRSSQTPRSGISSKQRPLETLLQNTKSDGKARVFVSPFKGANDEAREIAEAIAEDISTAFARQSGIILVSEMNDADFSVSGSLRGFGEKWRLSASLSDLRDGNVAWSDRFDEVNEDAFEIQDSFVTKVVGAVRIRLPSIMSEKLATQSLDDMNVSELLNYAMRLHFVPQIQSWKKARAALRNVLEVEPENWMAMTMLSFNLMTISRIFEWQGVSHTEGEEAHSLISRALELKSGSEVVHLVNGNYLLYVKKDLHAADSEARASLDLNPDYYHAIDLMGQVRLFQGKVEESSRFASRAADCDPGYPYRHLYTRDLGLVQCVEGLHDQAFKSFSLANSLAPSLPQNLIGMAIAAKLCKDEKVTANSLDQLNASYPSFEFRDFDPWVFADPAMTKKLINSIES